jgi:hypothetical protein
MPAVLVHHIPKAIRDNQVLNIFRMHAIQEVRMLETHARLLFESWERADAFVQKVNGREFWGTRLLAEHEPQPNPI